ncbi:MAG: alpha-glucosidase [Candidatus Lokiarchaeota archaeon]|nr:alpha-glucosidase [Candidatus Lokiarchaeota archaeon]
MTKKEKIVLIGAGSLQFGLGSVGSIINSEILQGSIVSLHDINQSNLDLVTQSCKDAIEQKDLDFELESTIDRKKALKNATFIINSIEVAPRFKLWELDYEIPRKYGNLQVYGENGGPGGLFHSLRVIPPILDICEDISKICPDAFVINYSNPMSRICLAIKRKYPSLNFVGLCHEFPGFIHHYSRILGTPLSNLEMRAGGLNHFGVLLSIRYIDKNRDAYPDLRKWAPEYLSNLKGSINDVDLIKYILEKFSYIPYTQDSHYGEYISWAWDKANIEGIRAFYNGYKIITLSTGKKIQKLLERGKGSRLVKHDYERAIPIIEGKLTNSNHEEVSVNLPNEDVITNLPRDLVVECPAIVTKSGLKAIKLGDYPKGLAALLRNQASVQDLVVEAILKKSKDIAFQALLLDPTIVNASKAEEMFEEMIKVNQDYIDLH